eukprot:SAG22_NODE_5481_length_1006_cov_1.947078_2_plen_152_part_00
MSAAAVTVAAAGRTDLHEQARSLRAGLAHQLLLFLLLADHLHAEDVRVVRQQPVVVLVEQVHQHLGQVGKLDVPSNRGDHRRRQAQHRPPALDGRPPGRVLPDLLLLRRRGPDQLPVDDLHARPGLPPVPAQWHSGYTARVDCHAVSGAPP